MPRPDTTQVELRTDTVEELIELLESSHTFVGDKMPSERREAITARLEMLAGIERSEQDAIALCGLPAAGKSHVAKKLGTVYNAPVISMGDAIREHAPDDVRNSDSLGEFAAQTRQERAETIPEWTAELAKTNDSSLVIIEGVRSVTDHDVLEEMFDRFYLVGVQAEFYVRLQRIQDRGREGEENFNAFDLVERDIRERNKLGFADVLDENLIDLTLDNGGDKKDLTINLSDLVENELPFEIHDGRPLGLTDKLEEMRRSQKEAGLLES